MTKEGLAARLRDRQRQKRLLQPEGLAVLDRLSDDEIIDCYLTCSCCARKQVPAEDLADLIMQAANDDDFFRLVDQKGVVLH